MESNQDVFISHSSADSKLAYAMCDYLEQKGVRCWIAPRDVQGGTEYAEAIIMGIRNCKIMVVLFNKNANDSIYVKNEVERAFNYKSILIPFRLDETTASATLELFLGSVHSLDATKGSPEDHFDLLYKNCQRVIGKKERVSESFSSETNTNERLWSYWVSNLTNETTKYGSINHSGAIVIQPMFENEYNFSEGLASVRVNCKWGFIDKRGNWVIQPMFENGENFSEGLASVAFNDKWGFIDKKGNWVIQPMFAYADNFSEELAIVEVNDKWGFIDKKGNLVIQPMFENACKFEDELAIVEVNDKWGFIDNKGNWVIQPMFENGNNFEYEIALVEVNDKYGYIDKKGNWVLQPTMYGNPDFYDDDDENEVLDLNMGDFSPDDFNLEDYFGNVNSKLKIKNQIDPKKVQNFIENMDGFDWDNYVTDELWVFYDKTFWQNGKEGFLICSDTNYIYLTVSYNAYLGSYIFAIDDVTEDHDFISNMEIVNEQLVISILNEDDKHYWDFSSEINNALYEFFQEEIIPRKSSL